MNAFTVLGDPVRRRILEKLSEKPHSSGEIVTVVTMEFKITQPAVSQHLKLLRENGFANVEVDGPRRVYSLETKGFEGVEEWLLPFRRFWEPKFEALDEELKLGKKNRS